MSQFTQFFPRSIPATQLATTSTPGNKRNRQIFYGPSVQSWSVPSSITEVEVHVWGGGGGGNGTACSGGGGGGGYARTRYKVSSTDILCITVGGDGGTSSVTIPTQSPISPMSATGGSNAQALNPACCTSSTLNPLSCATGCGCLYGGSGGTGSVSLGPTQPRSYCFTASGGLGGTGVYYCRIFDPAYPVVSDQGRCDLRSLAGGGGSAGSPRGPGGKGGGQQCFAEEADRLSAGGGGGIGGDAACIAFAPWEGCSWASDGGGSRTFSMKMCLSEISGPNGGSSDIIAGGAGKNVNYYTFGYGGGTVPTDYVTDLHVEYAPCKNDTWFSVEDIGGAGGLANSPFRNLRYGHLSDGGSGAGGGGSSLERVGSPTPLFGLEGCINTRYVAGNGGFLGGGGGGSLKCNVYVTPTPSIASEINYGGKGGAGGGSGGITTPGTPGVVIIYW
jgi:hypothetical protein